MCRVCSYLWMRRFLSAINHLLNIILNLFSLIKIDFEYHSQIHCAIHTTFHLLADFKNSTFLAVFLFISFFSQCTCGTIDVIFIFNVAAVYYLALFVSAYGNTNNASPFVRSCGVMWACKLYVWVACTWKGYNPCPFAIEVTVSWNSYPYHHFLVPVSIFVFSIHFFC